MDQKSILFKNVHILYGHFCAFFCPGTEAVRPPDNPRQGLPEQFYADYQKGDITAERTGKHI